MTDEKFVEELLYKSHSLGIYEEVMSKAQEMKVNNPRISRGDLFQQAFNSVKV